MERNKEIEGECYSLYFIVEVTICEFFMKMTVILHLINSHIIIENKHVSENTSISYYFQNIFSLILNPLPNDKY